MTEINSLRFAADFTYDRLSYDNGIMKDDFISVSRPKSEFNIKNKARAEFPTTLFIS
nr:hypothetical protein [uncultured Flavobacterium sp.]